MPLISTFGSSGSQSFGTRGLRFGGSAEFNLATDRFSLPQSTAFNYGTGNFTIECWIYPTASNTTRFIWNQDGTNAYLCTINGGQLYWFTGAGNAALAAAPTLFAWNHVAVVRNNGFVRIFLNGVGYGAVASSNFIGTPSQVGAPSIGNRLTNGANPFQGYITNFRIAKQALYTSNFIPSSVPFTRTSQGSTTTTLLMNMSSPSTLSVDSSASVLSITNTGVTYSTLTPYNVPYVTPPTVVVSSAVITPSTVSPSEGTTITVNVTGTNTPNGTYYYSLQEELGTGALIGDDFTSGSLTGSFTISGGSGSFPITVTRDLLTEGNEIFTIYVRQNSTSGPIIGTSAEITITDSSLTPVFTQEVGNVAEGSIANYTVQNIGPDGTYFWTINHITTSPADFSAVSGSFVVSGSTGGLDNGTGSFNFVILDDRTTEGNELFQVQVRSGSTSGPVIITSSNAVIIDTSKTPTFTVTPTSIDEGSSGSFTVNNLGPAGTYYWTILNGTTSNADFTATSGSFITDAENSNGTFSVSIASDTPADAGETFQVQIRTGSISGTVIATSSSVSITEPRQIPIGTFTDPFGATNTSDFYVEYDPLVTNRVVAAYVKESLTCWVRAGTITAGEITWGTEVQVNSAIGTFAEEPWVVFDPDNLGSFMVVWSGAIGTTGGAIYSRMGSISGTTITLGANTTADTGACFDPQVIRPTLTSNYVLTYRRNNSIYSRIGTVSGTTITWSAEVNIEITNAVSGYQRLISQGDRFAVLYTANISGSLLFRYAYGVVVTGTPTWLTTGLSSGANYTFVRTARSVPLTSDRGLMIVDQTTVLGNYLVQLTFNPTSLSFSTLATLNVESHGGNPTATLKIDPDTGVYAVFMYQNSGVKLQTITLDGSGGYVGNDLPIRVNGGDNNSIAEGIPVRGGAGRLIAWYNDNLSAGGSFRVKQIYGKA